jgi:hypothetical protein
MNRKKCLKETTSKRDGRIVKDMKTEDFKVKTYNDRCLRTKDERRHKDKTNTITLKKQTASIA